MSQTSQPLRLGAGMSAQAAALLSQLATLGVAARAAGAALRLSPASKVSPDLMADLRAHKAEVLALLTAPIVAEVAPPSAFTLGLTPADLGYHARQPVQAAPAAAPSDDVADGHTAALAAAVAALRAEPSTGDAEPMPHWPPGSWRKRRYASDTPGDLWTTLQRPVSWADPDARPTLGDWCGCCEGGRWWRRTARTDGGWCCSTCHPPDGAAPGTIEEVRT